MKRPFHVVLVVLVVLGSLGVLSAACGQGAAGTTLEPADAAVDAEATDGGAAVGDASADRDAAVDPRVIACQASCTGCCMDDGACKTPMTTKACLPAGARRGDLCRACAPAEDCLRYMAWTGAGPDARCQRFKDLGEACTEDNECATAECGRTTKTCVVTCRATHAICQSFAGGSVASCCDARERCEYDPGPGQGSCCMPLGTRLAGPQECDRCCPGLGCSTTTGPTGTVTECLASPAR